MWWEVMLPQKEGDSVPPGSLVCDEHSQIGQAVWPASPDLRGPHRHVHGAGGTLPGAPGLGGAAAGLRVCFGGDENVLEVDSGSGYLTP